MAWSPDPGTALPDGDEPAATEPGSPPATGHDGTALLRGLGLGALGTGTRPGDPDAGAGVRSGREAEAADQVAAPSYRRHVVRPGLLLVALTSILLALVLTAPPDGPLARVRQAAGAALAAAGDAVTLDQVPIAQELAAPSASEEQVARSAQASREVAEQLDALEIALGEGRYADGLMDFEKAADALADVLPRHGREPLQARAQLLRERLVAESQQPAEPA